MREILSHLRRHPHFFLSGVLCLFIVDIAQLISPLVLKLAIDEITHNSTLNLGRYAAWLLAIALVVAVFRCGWRHFLLGGGARIKRDLRRELYEQLSRQPASFFQAYPGGELSAYFSNDVEAVGTACSDGLVTLGDAVFMLLFSLAMMTLLSASLTACALIPLLVLPFFTRSAGRAIHLRFKKAQASYGELSERIREAYTKIRYTRAANLTCSLAQKIEESHANLTAHSLGLARVSSTFDPVISFAAGVSKLVVLWWGGLLVMEGQLSLGSLVAFLSYLSASLWPLMAYGVVVNIMERGTASSKRLHQLLAIPPAITDSPTAQPFPNSALLSISINEFRYPGQTAGPPALAKVSFSVAAGTTLGIVGLTAAGKSTLTRLIVRLFDLSNGEIKVGGLPIQDIALTELRHRILLVSNEMHLFSGTVRENVLLAKPCASPGQIEESARLAGLQLDRSELLWGLETPIGERGVTLSGGQRQRVCLARAFLRDPEILVLDDVLSALDVYKEQEILSHLAELRRNKTTLIVASRISAVQSAHFIIVLADGTIAERGTHQELLQKDGLYSRLARLQRVETGIT